MPNITKKKKIYKKIKLPIKTKNITIKNTLNKHNSLFVTNIPTLKNKSYMYYAPTINKKLITLKTHTMKTHQKHINCNFIKASNLKEPLKINVLGKCIDYYDQRAKNYLLSSLSKNKHINPKTIIMPLQVDANCWFNCMFVMFFISDKGRVFFHFLRQLMIEGKQETGIEMPTKLKNVFALLNYGIELSLSGNSLFNKYNTNKLISAIYKAIPSQYKKQNKDLINIGNAGNPIYYYLSIINYLKGEFLNMYTNIYIINFSFDWKNRIYFFIKERQKFPHIIALQVLRQNLNLIEIPLEFEIEGALYRIDSVAIINTTGEHFCAGITCEGKEMIFDGYSGHRLNRLNWKKMLNKDMMWQIKDYINDYNEYTKVKDEPFLWNFQRCYQILMYYRVK